MKHEKNQKIINNLSLEPTITVDQYDQVITISRENVIDTNKYDTMYINVDDENLENIITLLETEDYKLVVVFNQYKTNSDKKKGKKEYRLVKSINQFEQLGVRAYNTKLPQHRIRLTDCDVSINDFNIKGQIDPLNVLKVDNTNTLTTGSICSGCGASEESLKQLGFNENNHKNLFMCEWDDEVAAVYKDNFTSENYFKDFYTTDWTKVNNEKINLLFISTPCQEFSLASSKRRNLDSERGQLYIDALIQARKFKNLDRIISENVGSIISSGRHYSKIKKEDGSIVELNYIPSKDDLKEKNWTILKKQENKYVYRSKFNPKLKIGRTLKIVEDILINEFPDYNVYMDKLNTKDFGTTPQNRERFFLVMIKKHLDYGFTYPKKQPLSVKVEDLLEDNVDDSLIIKNRRIIKYPFRIYKDPKQLHHYGEVYNKNGTKSSHRQSRTIVYPVISPCLTTKNHTKIYHNGVVRHLSSVEQKRVHGFSESFKLSHTGDKNYDYRLNSHIMGNTISPSVMKELIKNVMFIDSKTTISNNTQYFSSPTIKAS